MTSRVLCSVFTPRFSRERARHKQRAGRWLLACLACIWALHTRGEGGPPTVETIIPEPELVLRELFMLEVQFDRPVTGVEAADLLINGSGATNVTEFAPGQFVFSFPQPPDGLVSVSWQANHGILDAAAGLGFASGSWSYILDSGNPPPEIWVSEFMAANSDTLRDEDGDNSDWIEIHNASETDVNLNGWFLTDDAAQPAKWRFPDVTIAPREFLLVFASEKDKTNVTGRLHTNFKLSAEGEFLALVSPGTNLVSAFAPAYPPQESDISYGRVPGAPEASGYFVQPTPGSANSQSGAGFASEVDFSRGTGTFLEPFRLELSAASARAVLRYTLDGALPTNSSPRYLEPIPITNSVQVRARTFQDGLLPGPPRTETFLRLSNNLTGFTSDLPVLIIHSLGKGAPSASRQTFAHVSVYEPAGGLTSLTNPPTLATRTGIKIRGSSTQGLAKSSYAVELWDEFNQDKDEEVLGLPADSDWVLYAPNSFEPVLIHNPFIHQLSRDMGQYSPRTRFVEVYLNKGTGPVAASHYNGIYVLEEKIKIGPDRVAIEKLKPEHLAAPEVTGGYLLKIDRLDPGDTGFSVAGGTAAYVDPKEREIRLSQRDPQEQYIRKYLASFSTALNSANWRDPAVGYAAYVDVPAWIDYHVLELLSGNVDALVLSAYFHKPRDGKLTFGPHWDFDRALGSTDGRDANPRNWVTGPFFTGWWSRLFRDPDFWQRWIDRYQELRGSHFSRTNINTLIDRLADEVRQAQPRERQKWRVTLRGGSYQSEVDRMKNWLSNRTDFIDKQLVQPPQLSAPGQKVMPGFALTLTHPTNATVYFTLDGSDPRAPQGALSDRARAYTAPLVIDENVRIVARSRNLAAKQTGGPPISSPWSGPVAATFTVAPPPLLLLSEIMFHPAPTDPPDGSDESSFEFVELLNAGAEPVNLVGYRFTNGINFFFASTGAVTQLGPRERLIVVKDLEAFRSRYPDVDHIAGQFSGGLANSRQALTLTGPLEEPIFDFEYTDVWQPLADGFGFSLVLADESITPDALGAPVHWRLSARIGGSPGEPDPAPPNLPRVIVNELLTNPAPGTDRTFQSQPKDALELLNLSTESADVSGWFITDNFREPKKFRISNLGTGLAPNAFLWFKSFDATGASFSFSKLGEEVYLFSADADGNLTGWVHGFAFGAAEEGVSFGRHVTSTGAEVFVAQSGPSFGAPNNGPRVGPVVITEIMPEPELSGDRSGAALAYIELHNKSQQSVPLFDPANPANTWALGGAVEFSFPAGQVLLPEARLVLTGFDPRTDAVSLARFRSRYGFSGKNVAGPWRGRLERQDGIIQLFKPGRPELGTVGASASVPQIVVEQVSHALEALVQQTLPGMSLQRRDEALFADDPANWSPAFATPGDRDTDGDGLPDSWEAAHGLDPQASGGSNGALADPDDDGLPNAWELRSGTDPLDSTSRLALQAAVRPTGEIILSFSSVPGRSYTIEHDAGLAQGGWQVLGTFLSGEFERVTVSDAPSGAQRFYRVTMP